MERQVLGVSWVAISRVMSMVTILLIPLWVLITLLITAHEPPENGGNGGSPKPETAGSG